MITQNYESIPLQGLRQVDHVVPPLECVRRLKTSRTSPETAGIVLCVGRESAAVGSKESIAVRALRNLLKPTPGGPGCEASPTRTPRQTIPSVPPHVPPHGTHLPASLKTESVASIKLDITTEGFSTPPFQCEVIAVVKLNSVVLAFLRLESAS